MDRINGILILQNNGKHFFMPYVYDLQTGLLGPYWEIRSPIFYIRPELARAMRKIEVFVSLVRTE